jgi:hypothetical protein
MPHTRNAMSKTKPVPVRLDGHTQARLKRAAKRMGSNTSCVIRLALIQQLPAIESGVIRLAPETKAPA